MTRPKSLSELLATMIGTDEFGATKGCDCPNCQAKRMLSDKQPGPVNTDGLDKNVESETFIQTVSILATQFDSISIGHTIADDSGEPQQIAIKILNNEDGMLLSIDEARAVIQGLQIAIDRIEH